MMILSAVEAGAVSRVYNSKAVRSDACPTCLDLICHLHDQDQFLFAFVYAADQITRLSYSIAFDAIFLVFVEFLYSLGRL